METLASMSVASVSVWMGVRLEREKMGNSVPQLGRSVMGMITTSVCMGSSFGSTMSTA